MTTHARRQNGFTLMEFLVAMGLLLAGLVTVGSLVPIGVRLQAASIESARAMAEARSVLAMLRADPRMLDPTRTPDTGGGFDRLFPSDPVDADEWPEPLLKWSDAPDNPFFAEAAYYRRDNRDPTIQVAVFVYRRPTGNARIPLEVEPLTINGRDQASQQGQSQTALPPDLQELDSEKIYPHVLLTSSTTGEAFVTKLVSGDGVSVRVRPIPPATMDQIWYVPDGSAAIVLGEIP